MPANERVVVFVGPLKPGRYEFVGDFSPTTARGWAVASRPTFGAAVVVFRELPEASLVLGIVLAAASGVAGSRRSVAVGVGAGVLGALLLAGGARSVSDRHGPRIAPVRGLRVRAR